MRILFLILPLLFIAGCGNGKVKENSPVCIPKTEFEQKFLDKGYEVVGVKREGPLCGYLVKRGKNANVLWYRDGVIILGVAFNEKKENLNLKLIKSLIPKDRLTIEEEKK